MDDLKKDTTSPKSEYYYDALQIIKSDKSKIDRLQIQIDKHCKRIGILEKALKEILELDNTGEDCHWAKKLAEIALKEGKR